MINKSFQLNGSQCQSRESAHKQTVEAICYSALFTVCLQVHTSTDKGVCKVEMSSLSSMILSKCPTIFLDTSSRLYVRMILILFLFPSYPYFDTFLFHFR